MKRFVKSLCLMVMALCIGFAFAACGDEEGTKYNYSGVTIEGEASMESTMKNLYDTMYKGATVEITDKKIKLNLSGATQEMEYTKSEDKYALSGNFVKQMQDTISATGVSGIKIDFYGLDTEAGFSMVLEEFYNDSMIIKININFVKA